MISQATKDHQIFELGAGLRLRWNICDREEDWHVLYWIIKTIILGPWLKVLFRPWVEGQENMPESGGMILASNHLSFSDSFYLALPVKRPDGIFGQE